MGSVGVGHLPPPPPLPGFSGHAHTPAVCMAPLLHSPAPPLSVSASAPPPFWPSFSSASSFPPSASTVQGSAGVHGLGVGHPLSSGVPPVTPYPSAPSTSAAPPPAADWPPAGALAYDPHDFYSSLPRTDTFVNTDDHLPEEDLPHVDPSTPLISLDSFCSEYRRMVEYTVYAVSFHKLLTLLRWLSSRLSLLRLLSLIPLSPLIGLSMCALP